MNALYLSVMRLLQIRSSIDGAKVLKKCKENVVSILGKGVGYEVASKKCLQSENL